MAWQCSKAGQAAPKKREKLGPDENSTTPRLFREVQSVHQHLQEERQAHIEQQMQQRSAILETDIQGALSAHREEVLVYLRWNRHWRTTLNENSIADRADEHVELDYHPSQTKYN